MKKHVKAGSFPWIVAKLMYDYSDYTIEYSDDNSTLFIGNVCLTKKYDENREVATLNSNLGYKKKYNEYHIGFVEETESSKIVALDENPMLFYFITNLDEHCFKEYKRRKNLIKRFINTGNKLLEKFRKNSEPVQEDESQDWGVSKIDADLAPGPHGVGRTFGTGWQGR